MQFQAVPFQVTEDVLTTTTFHENDPKSPKDFLDSRRESIPHQCIQQPKPFTCTTSYHTKSSIMCDKLQASKDGSVDLCHSRFAEYSAQSVKQQYSSNNIIYSSRKQRKYYGKGELIFGMFTPTSPC